MYRGGHFGRDLCPRNWVWKLSEGPSRSFPPLRPWVGQFTHLSRTEEEQVPPRTVTGCCSTPLVRPKLATSARGEDTAVSTQTWPCSPGSRPQPGPTLHVGRHPGAALHCHGGWGGAPARHPVSACLALLLGLPGGHTWADTGWRRPSPHPLPGSRHSRPSRGLI